MCDYSLEMYKTRDARVGDDLVLHHFPTGSNGFTRPGETDCATCLKEGTMLSVTEDGTTRTAEFCRLEQGLHHDGLLFEGENVPRSIQTLKSGSTATVIMIGKPAAEPGGGGALATSKLETV